MYETLEFYDSNGLNLKEVLKSCIYKYYMANKDLSINSSKIFKMDEKNSIIKSLNKEKMLSTKRN